MDKAPEFYTPADVNRGLVLFSNEVQELVYRVGKAKLSNILESMFDDPASNRLQALKELMVDVLEDIQKRIMEVERVNRVPKAGEPNYHSSVFTSQQAVAQTTQDDTNW